MLVTSFTTLFKAFVMLAFSAGLAIVTNWVRSDGIPLVTDIEYEIFAPCRDSEAAAETVDDSDLRNSNPESVLYVDARPVDDFAEEHLEGALNVPYSALFGAKQEDIEAVKAAFVQKKATRIIVYGMYDDPDAKGQKVELAKPLAEQLVESGLSGVKHIQGGLDELKKTGMRTVKDERGEDR